MIVLLGPTGVGKTGVSLHLAKILCTEIISADSMQIYRHMDIGTAKPSPEERTDVTHHMIDVIEPWERFSTGNYIAMVQPILEALIRRGRIPLVVGGTGLYIRAMTRGLFSGPSADWDLREMLRAMERARGGSLYACLQEWDPIAAEKITATDTRRIIRALEVCIKGGVAMSELQKTLTRPLPYRFFKIGMTRDRRELYRMIEYRVEGMIEKGLVREVEKVTAMIIEERARLADHRRASVVHDERRTVAIDDVCGVPSLQAIGYKEILRHLQGVISLDEAVHLIKKASKRYAKRQFTWFKKEQDIHWIDCTGLTDPRDVVLKIMPVLMGVIDKPQPYRSCNIAGNTLC